MTDVKETYEGYDIVLRHREDGWFYEIHPPLEYDYGHPTPYATEEEARAAGRRAIDSHEPGT